MNDDVLVPAFLDMSASAGVAPWTFRLPTADLRRSPEWNPDKQPVPLPVETAVQKATQAIQKVPINLGGNLPVPNSGYRWAGPSKIELLSTWLDATNATNTTDKPKKAKKAWFYKVYFYGESTVNMSGHGEGARGEVVVLLTGKTFLPQQKR